MTPKKKEAASSSDSSSSNSSTSSSSSSSSSGSDSSSSDTENTSTSGGKSGHATTDSEKKPASKKKNQPTNVKGKSEPPEPEKGKEKAAKSKSGQKSMYSSESDEASKLNVKRKPPTKPKASATVTPLPKTKSSTKTTQKKIIPPKKVAPKNVGKESTKTNSVPKLEEQKKLKTKSIFSPDNSSDSDDQTSTPPPPKLTAMKTAASKSLKAKPRTKSTQSDKSRASSISSNTSDSSRSSGTSSDSSGASGRVKGSRNTARKGRSTKKEKKVPGPPQLISDSDTGPIRKQTRSANTRRSKHVTSSRAVSESDSDTGSKTSASKSPVKKAGPKGPPIQRKPKGQSGNEVSHLMEHEERRCPLESCDSQGHLGGKYEKHFTIEACPLYHRFTNQECKDSLGDHRKREEDRKKAAAALKSSHVSSPTPEQKAYREKVKEMRSKIVTKEESDNESESSKDKQPDLGKYCNKYDLKLFLEAQAAASEMIEDELKQLANVRGTKYIEMGKFEMEVWYQSPYPEDYARLPKLYLCEFCLRYMKSRNTLERHAEKCVWRHPPGEEVYRKDKISVWEVDGKRYKSYCQNLCLLAKFFLDHKTLYYDVEPFLFYVMTISDSEGCHTVGYFSKEKNSFLNYNVSCILTLPPYQRQGYGRLLIDFSYLLTRVENKVGSPEKPLSDLGLISYRSYWKDVLLEYLCNLGGKQISIKDISQEMAINAYDIVSTLQALGMMKYWKGKHIVLKKQDVIEEHIDRSKRRGQVYKELDPECLKWTPFVPPTPPGPS